MVKSKITDFFLAEHGGSQRWHSRASMSCRFGGSEVELQDCELSSPACGKCGDEQAGSLMTSLLSCYVVQTTHSKILVKPTHASSDDDKA